MNRSTTCEIAGLTYPILIGDIGGTNARFAILKDSQSDPAYFSANGSEQYPSLEEAIKAVVLSQSPVQPKSAILAVAAIVEGEEIDLTNRGWTFRPAELIASLQWDGIVVLNDFEAQALAVLALDDGDMKQIGGGESVSGAPRVVLGPGTGLGVAGLVKINGAWNPVAGEGGHVDIGPRNDNEINIFRHLKKLDGRVTAEEVLSGRGLVNLYGGVCGASGEEPGLATPEEISAAGLSGQDNAAKQTLELFATLLGRVAGDVALIFMASGGVYLTGGITREILPVLKTGVFREAFDNKAPHRGHMEKIPVKVVTDPLAALAGLTALARNPDLFGMEISRRFWQAND